MLVTMYKPYHVPLTSRITTSEHFLRKDVLVCPRNESDLDHKVS